MVIFIKPEQKEELVNLTNEDIYNYIKIIIQNAFMEGFSEGAKYQSILIMDQIGELSADWFVEKIKNQFS